MGREGAESGAGDEAEAEGGADDSHRLRSLGPGGDVGDSGGSHGEVSAECAGHDAREQEEPERAAQHPNQIAEGRARHGQ